MVERVDAFESQLELDAFPDPGVLDDRHVQVVGSVRTDSGKPRIQGTQILAGLQGGVPFEAGIDIEPPFYVALTFRQRNLVFRGG